MRLNLNQSLKAPKILLTKACNHYVYCINFLDCWHRWTAVNNLELSDTIWVQLSFKLHATKRCWQLNQISTANICIYNCSLLGFNFVGTRLSMRNELLHTWLCLPGNISLKEEWSRKSGSWILDFRILRFGSRQVSSFSFAHKRQADRGLVDEREFKDEMWSNCVQKWRLATDTEL